MAFEVRDHIRTNGTGGQSRKPYSKPQLVVHGDVEKITGAVGNVGEDDPLGTTGSRLSG